MVRRKQFDVFLSYSSKDKTWVNQLKEALQSKELKVWLDHDQIRPGDLFANVLERGLEESKAMALIVSPESIESGWVEEEYSRALSLAQGKQQPLQLIPVILREAELPGFLARRNWVDFREESMFAQNLEQLIWSITGKRPTMSTTHTADRHFQVGLPLSGDTSLYIERKADREALIHLRNMDYISFIEPRLQGKTSLIYRLMKQLAPRGYAFVICDLMNARFRRDSQEEWYHSLGEWVVKNLDFITEEAQSSLPINSTTWQTFLEAIAQAAKETKQNVVIILEELRDMPPAYATPFFTVIRSIYNERAITPALNHLTFITSGAFNPKELIQDEGVSKFNVDQRIELEDFNLSQVRQLVDNLQLPADVAETVAKRVYYWTDGQPYLTQKLCLFLTEIPESELIQSAQPSRGVYRLAKQLFEDQRYMQRIRGLGEREPKLFQYIQDIANGHIRPRFNQALNDEHFRLANIYGVIKADSKGRCRIRNRICEQALKEYNLTHAENKMSFIEANWQKWTGLITKVLKNQGKVSQGEISEIPNNLWTQTAAKYTQERPESTVILSQGELRLERGAQWIARWNQAWKTAIYMLSRRGAFEQTESLDIMTNVLAEATGLHCDNQWHKLGTLYATTVTTHALHLNIPGRFPVIFVPPAAVSSDIISVLISLCSLMQLRQFFSLVFVLQDEEAPGTTFRLREILQNSSYIDDFIVLEQDDLFRIYTAPNPVTQLNQCIVSHISPSAVSPFVVTDYVTGPMFFGRDREIRDITLGLAARSFTIVGNRRIGKSSLLRQVKKILEQSQMYSLTLLNLQGSLDLVGLYRYIYEDPQLHFQVGKVESEAFRAFVDYLAGSAAGRTVVILVDEPDAVLLDDESRGYPLSWIWRELSQNGRCRFIFAGHRVLTRIMRNASSPFFNFGERLHLGYLEQLEANRLLTVPLNEMGIELANAPVILDRVWQVSAGHPSVIQLVGRNLLKCLKRGERVVRIEHLEQVLSAGAFVSEYSDTIWGGDDSSELQGVSSLERAILLLGNAEGFTEADILDTLARNGFHAKDEAVYDALDMLVAFGLLASLEQVYTCTIPYFIGSIRNNQRIDYWLSSLMKSVNE